MYGFNKIYNFILLFYYYFLRLFIFEQKTIKNLLKYNNIKPENFWSY